MAPYEQHEVAYGEDKKIFYHAAGPANGPLLIFVHGWPGIGKLWKPQIDAFAAMGFRVAAPDMPGMLTDQICQLRSFSLIPCNRFW